MDPLLDPAGRIRALLHPRADATRARWAPDDDGVIVADDPLSFAGIAGTPAPIVTIHYLTKLDAAALERRSLSDIQDRRAERRAAKRAALILAYSARVAAALPADATFVPIAYPIPDEPLPFVEEPVAAVLADWRWEPNRIALRRLLRMWPDVRRRVPAARLLLAGRGLQDIASSEGVEALGFVASSTEVLARAAVLTFPVPATSGPKVKVLEALISGLPVVTTPPGIEGLAVTEGAIIAADRARFVDELATLLVDPERRRGMAVRGREAAALEHAPRAAARTRVNVIARALPGR